MSLLILLPVFAGGLIIGVISMGALWHVVSEAQLEQHKRDIAALQSESEQYVKHLTDTLANQ